MPILVEDMTTRPTAGQSHCSRSSNRFKAKVMPAMFLVAVDHHCVMLGLLALGKGFTRWTKMEFGAWQA